MHGLGTDLHLHHLAFRTDDSRVQGLIPVFLGVGDVIVEFVGNMAPECVHDTKRGVTVTDFRHQDADGPNIVHLGKIDALAPHFPPDTVDVLSTP